MRHGSTFYFQQSRSMLCPFCHPARIVFSTNLCHYHDCQYGFQRYRSPLGLRLSLKPQNFGYRPPTSKTCSSLVLHFISTSIGFFSFSATKGIPEEGLLSPTVRKPCRYKFMILDYVARITFLKISQSSDSAIITGCNTCISHASQD